ncbi:Transposable element Tcb2 transposase, partial [Araneus ventricosus]
NYLSKICYLLL